MHKRFVTALSKPSSIKFYLNDSFKRVLAFFFLLVLLVFIPRIINEVKSVGLRDDQLSTMMDEYQAHFGRDITIKDGKLNLDHFDPNNGFGLRVDLISIELSSTKVISEDLIIIALAEEGIYYMIAFLPVSFHSYHELGLSNFDFSDIRTQNTSLFIQAVNQVVSANNLSHQSIILLTLYLAELIQYAFLSLLFAFIIGRGAIPFKLRYKAVVYASTVYFVALLLAQLYQVGSIAWVGLILFMSYLPRVFKT